MNNLKLLTRIFPLSLFADLPNWYFTESSSKVPICLKLNSSISQLRIIAIAKAQGIIQGKKVLKSGIFYFDGVKNYCILYGK